MAGRYGPRWFYDAARNSFCLVRERPAPGAEAEVAVELSEPEVEDLIRHLQVQHAHWQLGGAKRDPEDVKLQHRMLDIIGSAVARLPRGDKA